MPKTNLKDIFKRGAKFEVKKLDFNDPEIKKAIEDCHRAQQECLDRKKIDWEQLNRFITI